uniref:DUF7778 domain-containing protein n=1 Tax=Caenorhabditis japonica TaxID=281687 RepID=A0A8R1E7B8_CAEJA
MSVHQPLERHEALQLAKGFNKFIPLPHVRRWKVHQTDVLHRGTVLSFLRTKSSFFLLPDDISSLKSRQITVTSHGYMVVYEDEDRGLIVNLRAASHVFCTADKYKGFKGPYTRCHIKIRLPRGNIHLFVRDAEIHKWTCAIMKASSSASSPATKIEPIPPIPSTSHHATPCCPTQR